MSYVGDCLKNLDKLVETLEDNIIQITVNIQPESIDEAVNQLDDQSLEEWYDFASTIEGIIEHFGKVVNISSSKHPNSLSEYIDFYSYTPDGELREYLVDLRLSDHRQTSNGRDNRIRHVRKLDTNYELVSVVVNGTTFKTYHDAIVYVRKLLAERLMKD